MPEGCIRLGSVPAVSTWSKKSLCRGPAEQRRARRCHAGGRRWAAPARFSLAAKLVSPGRSGRCPRRCRLRRGGRTGRPLRMSSRARRGARPTRRSAKPEKCSATSKDISRLRRKMPYSITFFPDMQLPDVFSVAISQGCPARPRWTCCARRRGASAA